MEFDGLKNESERWEKCDKSVSKTQRDKTHVHLKITNSMQNLTNTTRAAPFLHETYEKENI